MSTTMSPVSDMLITVKSREVQRGMLAEMGGEPVNAAPHFLAAAHLELVLANDFVQAGQEDLAFRSRLSAASCFWRGGQVARARVLFDAMIQDFPDRESSVRHAIEGLEQP